jgi:RimJ/RimL family protein N-acetyltransferase
MRDPSNAAERPILREVRESDIEFFYEYQADPEAAAMAAFTPRDRDEAFAKWREIMANPALTARAVVVGDLVAGHVGSWEVDGHREVGYWIGREFWGRGIATAALRDFLEIVTERPLEGWSAPHNIGSARVLEKNGFIFDRDEEGYRVFRLG